MSAVPSKFVSYARIRVANGCPRCELPNEVELHFQLDPFYCVSICCFCTFQFEMTLQQFENELIFLTRKPGQPKAKPVKKERLRVKFKRKQRNKPW